MKKMGRPKSDNAKKKVLSIRVPDQLYSQMLAYAEQHKMTTTDIVLKDLRGRSLRKGEVQRSSDKRYMYTYTDPMGRRKFIYANDLTELREKEAKLMKDQLDGLDLYVAGKASVNDTFDRYMSTKYNLCESTKSSYLYTYDHYVRDTFGKKRIAEIKYSDVLQLYYYLLNETKISLGTLDTVHCLLHPTFQLAVRDEIIRNYLIFLAII